MVLYNFLKNRLSLKWQVILVRFLVSQVLWMELIPMAVIYTELTASVHLSICPHIPLIHIQTIYEAHISFLSSYIYKYVHKPIHSSVHETNTHWITQDKHVHMTSTTSFTLWQSCSHGMRMAPWKVTWREGGHIKDSHGRESAISPPNSQQPFCWSEQ